MRAIDVFVRQITDARDHPWESLLPTIRELTEAEAAWQAPCYRAESDEAGWPANGSILWHLVHLAHCKQAYLAQLEGRENPDFEPPQGLDAALDRLSSLHDAQRDAIAALRDADLEREMPGGVRLDEFLTSTLRHDVWHAAQIAVARRLYRTR